VQWYNGAMLQRQKGTDNREIRHQESGGRIVKKI